MCEKCIANQKRCDELADWLKAKDLLHLQPEDAEQMEYLTNKIAREIPSNLGLVSALSPHDLLTLLRAIYGMGLKKGYEIRELEVNFGRISEKKD